MRMRLGTAMIVVAAAAFNLWLSVHVRSVIDREDDFAIPILIMEGMVTTVVCAIGFAIVRVVQFVREDQAYANRLRRNEYPDTCPFVGLNVAGLDNDRV